MVGSDLCVCLVVNSLWRGDWVQKNNFDNDIDCKGTLQDDPRL